MHLIEPILEDYPDKKNVFGVKKNIRGTGIKKNTIEVEETKKIIVVKEDDDVENF